MTSEAKIASNRVNALKSTGPRTAAGKALAKYNALRHGVLTALPLVPGEDVAAWDQHREGVGDSLAPAGVLETALAERVALTLWRLARLARAEALAASAALADAALPTPAPSSLADSLLGRAADPLAAAISQARKDAGARMLARAARDYAAFLDALPGLPESDPVEEHVADGVLHYAWESVNLSDCDAEELPDVAGAAFLARVGVAHGRDWTAGKVRAGLAVLAAYVNETAGELAAAVADDRRRDADAHARKGQAADRRLAGLRERKRTAPARRAAAALLPAAGRADQLIRYEAHLQKVLTTTLHELERLQAVRAGRDVPAPLVVDVTVTGAAGG